MGVSLPDKHNKWPSRYRSVEHYEACMRGEDMPVPTHIFTEAGYVVNPDWQSVEKSPIELTWLTGGKVIKVYP